MSCVFVFFMGFVDIYFGGWYAMNYNFMRIHHFHDDNMQFCLLLFLSPFHRDMRKLKNPANLKKRETR